MNPKRIIVILCLIFVTNLGHASKILAIFPMAIPSHYILGNALLRGLAEAGHNVTMISPYSEKNPPANGSYRDITLTGFVEEHEGNNRSMEVFRMEHMPTLLFVVAFPLLGVYQTEKILNHTKVQELINSGETFDVVIAGQFLDDAVKAFASIFNAHLILFSSVMTNTMINNLVGNPSLPSYAPEFVSNFPPRMSFIQRVQNTINKFVLTCIMHTIAYPQHNKLVQKYFPKPIDFNEVLYNVSLVLLNSHVSISTPLPYVPNMIDIGGFHIKKPKKLPEDLQLFLDNAKEGVVYVSMGSHIKGKDLPVEKRTALLETFRKLKQKVLWKWEDDVLPGQPSNVKLGKWLPQQDILAHPNVKAFITHCGLLSTTETVYHGVPIVAIPLMGDQKSNAYAAEMAGYGAVVPFQDLSQDKLSLVLEEVLTNPKYRNEVQRRSKIMKDRQVDPLDNAVYWVDYVIRHNGAKHLRVPYLGLAWYQFYLLDVFAFLLAVVVGVYFLLRSMLRYILKIRRSKVKGD